MKNFTTLLQAELEQNLELIAALESESTLYLEEAIQTVLKTLEQLRDFVKRYTFESKAQEIEFFKVIKPHFASKLIYYIEIYNIEMGKPVGSTKIITKYYENEEKRLKKFYCKNSDFYKYYRSGSAALDKKYFIRRKLDIKLFADSHSFQSDKDFTTAHDFTVARIIANDAIQQFISRRKSNQEQCVITTEADKKPIAFLKWTGTKVALVELLYAIHASNVINEGEVSLKAIAQTAETIFNIDLGQYNRIFLEIKSRKTIEQTSFLNVLKSNLEKRMDDSYKA
ncbi:RteC domain-containing protein [Flavobacterium tegetincola]|uniref:RteC domain-containing protein n=1 Tax=Flavobacterium tegetincola TaxID=150172 RepID=UPI00040E7BEC|nr:RteC domain-containing protein [Flavobacterium tegetincola]